MIQRLAVQYGIRCSRIAVQVSELAKHSDLTALVKQLLSLSPSPDAVWAQNDWLALLLKQKLEQMGFRIPRDFSLIGYDDRGEKEGLSTITHSRREIGAAAVDIVSRLFENGAHGKAMHLQVPSFYLSRESVKTVNLPRSG
ncbi:MAG: substrate-binding domain-containing protein [Lentisphaeria bacterium]|nr:substrate-binding domain-containing protein [Lentisphaeria bacterium]